jgi:BirA family biotin operon repressor/biotin-[acetyl-CoA-carboxylase] ligase
MARPGSAPDRLGHPRVHLRVTDSTNRVARELAASGAVHGTLVTAREQTAGRGRQGRGWHAPPGAALVCSWVLRDPPPLLSLAAGVATAEVCGQRARVKWPNDVLIEGRKVAGILVEGRPQEGWAVLGIGLNVALELSQLPNGVRERAATLGRAPQDIEPLLHSLCASLERWLAVPVDAVLDGIRARDALGGHLVRWESGMGTAAGIDSRGRLLVACGDGSRVALDAGEVHLGGAWP